MDKLSNVIITGGAGFIGSNVVNFFVEKYPNIKFYNIDKLDYCSSLKNITVSDKPNYKFIEGDICDRSLIGFVLREYQIDCIMHFAAQSHVDNSFNNSLQYTHDNILGTHTLLECTRLYGKLKRFIHVSTDECYGFSDIEDTDMKHEKSLLNPTNPYSASKAAAEMLCNSYYYSYHLPIIITRGNNVYGPRQYPEKLIPKFITLLLDNKKCTIHGSGNTVRTFINVHDVCTAFDTIANYGKIGEIYNVGCEDEYSVMDIATKLVEKLKDGKVEDWIEYVEDRKFNDTRYFISSEKLKALGWEQKIDFEDGLNEVIEWYKSNRDNWK